ncbi:hypothetical protein IQ227_16955, partial [Anabaena aphanizomenioides LEGE 00250]|nr:hypothetical protein [Sphaerospermopsis aphanizomenoides LEGE 00250]
SREQGAGEKREVNNPVTSHQSPITSHQSPITNHQFPLFLRKAKIVN